MAKALSLGELRRRHQHCITWLDIWADLKSGDLPMPIYEHHKHKIGPACSEPTDPVCAAPSVSDLWIHLEMEKSNAEPIDNGQ